MAVRAAVQSHQQPRLFLSFFSATYFMWLSSTKLLHSHKLAAGAPTITSTFQMEELKKRKQPKNSYLPKWLRSL